MDFEKLKAEFEKLEYINEKLEYLNFDEHLDCYVEKSGGMPVGLAAWVNGALYGFQQAAKAEAVPEGYVLVPKELTHEQAVKISDHPEFFEIYQNIVLDSDTSEDSVSVLLRIAHKAMIEAQEPK